MAGWGFVVCVVALVTTQPLARTISSRRKQVSGEDLVWFTLISKQEEYIPFSIMLEHYVFGKLYRN